MVEPHWADSRATIHAVLGSETDVRLRDFREYEDGVTFVLDYGPVEYQFERTRFEWSAFARRRGDERRYLLDHVAAAARFKEKVPGVGDFAGGIRYVARHAAELGTFLGSDEHVSSVKGYIEEYVRRRFG